MTFVSTVHPLSHQPKGPKTETKLKCKDIHASGMLLWRLLYMLKYL
jgi:hypothetical protein